MTKLKSLMVAMVVLSTIDCASVDASEPKSGKASYAACVRDARRDGPSSNPVGNGTAVRREIRARQLCKTNFAEGMTASR